MRCKSVASWCFESYFVVLYFDVSGTQNNCLSQTTSTLLCFSDQLHDTKQLLTDQQFNCYLHIRHQCVSYAQVFQFTNTIPSVQFHNAVIPSFPVTHDYCLSSRICTDIILNSSISMIQSCYRILPKVLSNLAIRCMGSPDH